MVVAEQQELLGLLVELADDEWDHATLCGAWRVRDVVAHLISMNEAGPLGLLQATASMDWFNATGVRRRGSLGPADLLDAFQRSMGIHGLGRVVPAPAMLIEVVAHSQDIRRPLGRQRRIEPDRLLELLPRCVSPVSYVPGFGFSGARRRVRGLRLVALDIDWSWGRGPALRGPAEALLMAVLGRHAAVSDLVGDGVALLAARTGHLDV
jgi:uncharacterized protein (TIGR03083 family)